MDKFVRISICCCRCWTTETPLTPFFSRLSITPIPLDLLGKEVGIRRQFHRPIKGNNKSRYSIHQLVDRPTGVFNRLLYRALHLLVKAIDAGRQFHIRIGQTVGRYRSTISRTYWSQNVSIHVAIGNSNRYRSTMWHTYCKSNSLLCRFIRTYWSKK